MVGAIGDRTAWGSTRNGISSADAGSQQMYLIESADVDVRRLGVVDQDGTLAVLETLTQGTLTASLPFAADLSSSASFQVTVGGSTYAVTVPDNSHADRLTTLADVRTALQSAGIASTLLDAQLVDAQGNVASAPLDAGTDYYLQVFLPTGSSASTFSLTPTSDILACQVTPIGFLVGEVSTSPHPDALRTFEDFQNVALFPSITITPVYDSGR